MPRGIKFDSPEVYLENMKRYLALGMALLVFTVSNLFVSSSASAIEGGDDAPEANFTVFIVSMGATQNYSCTGALIAPRLVVTAAHCINEAKNENRTVCVSLTRQSSSQCAYAEDIYFNANYVPNSSSTEDIGFIIIPEEIKDSDYLPVGKPGDEINFYNPYLYGQGPINEQTEFSNTPQVGKIERYLLNLDGNPNRFAFYSRFWAVCHGDSGSPIVIDRLGAPIIIGVLNSASTNGFSGRVNCSSPQVFTGLYQGTATLLSAYSNLMQEALDEIARRDLETENDMKQMTADAIESREIPSFDAFVTGNYVTLDVWLAGRSDLGFSIQSKTKKGKWKTLGNFPVDGSDTYQYQYTDIKIKVAKDARFLRIKEIATNLYSTITTFR